jgi:hypothetical protein
LPWLKKHRQRLRPGLLGLESPDRSEARPKNPEDARPQTESGAEKREAFARGVGAGFRAANWDQIKSSDFTITDCSFGEDDWGETLSTLRTL